MLPTEAAMWRHTHKIRIFFAFVHLTSSPGCCFRARLIPGPVKDGESHFLEMNLDKVLESKANTAWPKF